MVSAQSVRRQGCDAEGRLWFQNSLEKIGHLEGDSSHVDVILDADEEIKSAREWALRTSANLRNVRMSAIPPLTISQSQTYQGEVARGVEILLLYAVLQSYDENSDAMDVLEVSSKIR